MNPQKKIQIQIGRRRRKKTATYWRDIADTCSWDKRRIRNFLPIREQHELQRENVT